jgi:cobalt/nickel transport system permease protein
MGHAVTVVGLEPRAVLLAWLAAALSVGLCSRVAGVLLLAGLSVVVVLRDWRAWWPKAAGVLAFAVLAAGLLPWTVGGEAVDLLGQAASRRGLELAGLVVGKMLALFNLTWLLLSLTTVPDLVSALAGLGLPRRGVALVSLTHRFLMLFQEELARLRLALRVRGFRNRLSRHAWRTAAQATGSLLVHGLDRAERVEQAWELRGYAGVMPGSAARPWSWREGVILCLGAAAAALPWLPWLGSN